MLDRYSTDELFLSSNSIAIRASALDRKYPGGRQAFSDKFLREIANESIFAYPAKGAKAKEIFDCLDVMNFDYRKEFVFVNISLFSRGDNSFSFPLDPEVTWLKAHYENGQVVISYIEN